MATKAVTLKNENGDTIYPVTDASLVNNIKKDVMTITGDYNDTSFAYNTTIQLNTLLGSTGSKLTFASSSYGIKIGAGVSKVLVSASVFFSSGAAGYGWLKVYKNGTFTNLETIAYTTTNSFGSATLNPVVMSVQENDVITLFNPENCRIRGTGSYLTVEVIE